jgi:hypothetical protein
MATRARVLLKHAGYFIAATAALWSGTCSAQVAALQEFVQGSKRTFNSAGDPKAKGLTLTFEYPRSWAPREASRPNTLAVVFSENGRGLEACSLVAKGLPLLPNETVSQRDIEEILATEALRHFMPPGGVYLQGGKTSIDGLPAGWLIYQLDTDRAGLGVRTRSIAFPVIYRKQIIALSCTAVDPPEASDEQVTRHFDAYLPLFRHIAASLIVHNRWKN